MVSEKILEYGGYIYDKQDFFYLFWRNLFKKKKKKNQNCLFKMTINNYTNSNTLNLMVMFTFSVMNLFHLACFGPGIPFMDNLGPNIQNCRYWMKFGAKFAFLDLIGPKRQTCMVRMELGAKANLNMLNLMVMFICPVLDCKHTFWTNFVREIMIV